MSREAATYGAALGWNVRSYLEAAFAPIYDDVDVSVGGVVDVPTEHGYETFVASGGWAERVSDGFLGYGDVRPVDGVNLLVTDGEMTDAPTGAAQHGAASVGGARYLAELPPVDSVPSVTPFSYPRWVAQVVIHECGHALGLEHDHGSIEITGDRAVVTPMVSSYAWARDEVRTRQFDFETSACGEPYPPLTDERRYLSLRFSTCASDRLRCWSGGVLSKHGLVPCCSRCRGPLSI